jgi:arylsulfatase A
VGIGYDPPVMKRRMAVTIWGLAVAGAATAAVAADLRPPNVVLIMCDDVGYECIAANGGESYATPRLDALAASGMRFTRCHVQPLCTPTRVELMTGRSNARNYVDFGVLPAGEPTFGNLLAAGGHATGICGKWQLGREPDLPRRVGFAEALLWQHTRRPPRYANPGLERDGVERDFTGGAYGPTLVSDFAIDFLTRHRDGPFFLYYPMILAHDPFQPTPDSPDWDPEAEGELVNRHVRHFGEMMAYLDRLVGRLVDRLDALGIRDNTLLIFLGDNGTHRGVTSRFAGRDVPGGKGLTTHRGTHVPLIVSWPGVVPAGRVCDHLVAAVDILPTICEATGVAVPEGLDGRSILPQLRGEPGEPRPWIYSWYWPRPAQSPAPVESAFDAAYKLYGDGRLYDLTADPDETRPLPEPLAPPVAAARETLRQAIDSFRR